MTLNTSNPISQIVVNRPYLFPRGRIIANFLLYEALGIDSAKVINASPVVLGYAPESVKEKVRRIKMMAFLLKWEGSITDLFNNSPKILSHSRSKMRVIFAVLRRLNNKNREVSIKMLIPGNFVPLEKYIIAYNYFLENTDGENININIKDLIKEAKANKLSSSEPKSQALKLAGLKPNDPVNKRYLRLYSNPKKVS